VHATGKPTIVVLINGRPLTVGWIVENTPAVLEAWMVATEAGNAIADVLFGDVNPSGKLPVTWPRSVGQVPLYYNHMNTGRPRKRTTATLRNIWMFPGRPLFPFGLGLIIRNSRLTNLQLSAATYFSDQGTSRYFEV